MNFGDGGYEVSAYRGDDGGDGDNDGGFDEAPEPKGLNQFISRAKYPGASVD